MASDACIVIDLGNKFWCPFWYSDTFFDELKNVPSTTENDIKEELYFGLIAN